MNNQALTPEGFAKALYHVCIGAGALALAQSFLPIVMEPYIAWMNGEFYKRFALGAVRALVFFMVSQRCNDKVYRTYANLPELMTALWSLQVGVVPFVIQLCLQLLGVYLVTWMPLGMEPEPVHFENRHMFRLFMSYLFFGCLMPPHIRHFTIVLLIWESFPIVWTPFAFYGWNNQKVFLIAGFFGTIGAGIFYWSYRWVTHVPVVAQVQPLQEKKQI